MNYKKYLCVGPGGLKCSCCFDAPGSKGRKIAFRAAKKKEREEAFKIESFNYEKGDNNETSD